MKIISASRRTDIPAFYSRWLLNRLRTGFCHSLNPFNGKVYRVSLRPEDCLALVFWSRDPRPLLPHLERLQAQGYRFYFHISINGYPQAIETNNPPLERAIATFQRLSQSLTAEFVQWRYDPILLSDITPTAYHLKQFDRLSQQLAGYTQRCYFSFVNFYGKTERNLKKVSNQQNISFQRPTLEEKQSLAQQLSQIAASRNITLYSCCDDTLVGEKIEKSRCIDIDIVRKLHPVALSLKAAPTRQDCGCIESIDIGAYHTCGFGCTYCYATTSRTTALKRLHHHDANDTVLWRPATLAGIDLSQREYQPKRKQKH